MFTKFLEDICRGLFLMNSHPGLFFCFSHHIMSNSPILHNSSLSSAALYFSYFGILTCTSAFWWRLANPTGRVIHPVIFKHFHFRYKYQTEIYIFRNLFETFLCLLSQNSISYIVFRGRRRELPCHSVYSESPTGNSETFVLNLRLINTLLRLQTGGNGFKFFSMRSWLQ